MVVDFHDCEWVSFLEMTMVQHFTDSEGMSQRECAVEQSCVYLVLMVVSFDWLYNIFYSGIFVKTFPKNRKRRKNLNTGCTTCGLLKNRREKMVWGKCSAITIIAFSSFHSLVCHDRRQIVHLFHFTMMNWTLWIREPK